MSTPTRSKVEMGRHYRGQGKLVVKPPSIIKLFTSITYILSVTSISTGS
jgi:hypothetical protein